MRNFSLEEIQECLSEKPVKFSYVLIDYPPLPMTVAPVGTLLAQFKKSTLSSQQNYENDFEDHGE